MIDIAEVKKNRRNILDTAFYTEEQELLKNRHIRSTAGVFALKQALCSMLHRKTGLALVEKDFHISWSETGRPELKAWPTQLDIRSFHRHTIFLSISHTRNKAYGLAVCQEPSHE